MKNLIEQYRKLKTSEDDRNAALKNLKAKYEAEKDSINVSYGNLDDDIQKLRAEIYDSMGGNTLIELDNAKVELVTTRSVKITHPDSVATWLHNRGKDDIIKPREFEKAKLNKIVCAFAEIDELIPGTQIETKETLRITLND